MAPFSKAVTVQQAPSTDASGTTKLYKGNVDPEWTIGSVPNGGYVLALVMEACIRFQSTTAHVDPMHITAHYIRTTATAPFEVRVRNIRTGAMFTNITAELVQEGVLKVMAHAIFGVNNHSSRDKLKLTLNPPSTYARRHPLYTDPSTAIDKPLRHTWRFHKRAKWTKEKEILAKNEPNGVNRTSASTVGGGGVEWGAWFEFADEGEEITNTSLCFLADMCLNTPTLLPPSERPGLTTSWYPTMTLALEFKNKIPPPSSKHASRTVGLYSLGRFMTAPQGRHEAYVEVWTAPSALGEAPKADNWREDQICLATATQMGITLPFEVNQRKGKSTSAKL
ncbi:hypothetical protein CPC08DRAFT_817087 [Agrocybe pediades]|nr:hypothetical protein CPC08DRAFT_817087 [Agrocybe pediades]